MRFDPRALLGSATGYAAQHDAPDFEKLIGNPTWRDRYRYVRKSVINVTTGLSTSGVLVLVPDPTAYYVAGGLLLLGWVFHYQVPNGPKPRVKDKTGWVAATVPPPSTARPQDHDIEVDLTGRDDTEPVMSEADAAAQVALEDQAASTEPDVPPTPREQGS